jgi:hypothetical protein
VRQLGCELSCATFTYLADMVEFEVPIATGGSFACSAALGSDNQGIYVLSFISLPDNRVTLPFIEAFALSLRTLERTTGSEGVLVITSSISRVFSNGLDVEHTKIHEDFFEQYLGLLGEVLV